MSHASYHRRRVLTRYSRADRYRYGSDYTKSSFYTYFAASPGTMMSTLPNALHAEKRKAQSPAFAMQHLVSLEEFVDSALEQLLGLLDREVAAAAKAGKEAATVELAEILQLLALDVGESRLQCT